MKVSKWGNSLAIRIPGHVADTLGFAQGDELRIEPQDGKLVIEKKMTREQLRERLAEIRKTVVWPSDYRFDRDEANSRDD